MLQKQNYVMLTQKQLFSVCERHVLRTHSWNKLGRCCVHCDSWSLAEPGLVTSRSSRTGNAFVTSMPVLLARKISPENLSLNKDLRHKTTSTENNETLLCFSCFRAAFHVFVLFMFSYYIPFPIHACQKLCMSTSWKMNNNVTLCSHNAKTIY